MLDETAVITRERAIERGYDANGQRPVETEWIADREDFLAHLKVVAGADGNGLRRLRRNADAKHSDVVHGARADERGRVVAPIRKPDVGRSGAGDDVQVGDDVTFVVPDESRAGAARDGENIARPVVHYTLARRDVHDGGFRGFEYGNVALLIGREFTARCDGTGRRFGAAEPVHHIRREIPERQQAEGTQESDVPDLREAAFLHLRSSSE